MGVKACDRKGCDNVCCDYYSQGFGYLCAACYNELYTRGPMAIAEFMNSAKQEAVHPEDRSAWEAKLRRIFT